jgi:hypothetical protein
MERIFIQNQVFNFLSKKTKSIWDTILIKGMTTGEQQLVKPKCK